MKRLSLSETSDDTSSFCIPPLSTSPSADRNRPDDDEIPMDWQQCGRDRDNPKTDSSKSSHVLYIWLSNACIRCEFIIHTGMKGISWSQTNKWKEEKNRAYLLRLLHRRKHNLIIDKGYKSTNKYQNNFFFKQYALPVYYLLLCILRGFIFFFFLGGGGILVRNWLNIAEIQ